MPNSKPYVAVACICERVLKEPDGVASIIRIVDTYHLMLPDDTSSGAFPLSLTLTIFVSLKSGDVTGQHEIAIVLRQPNGKSQPAQKSLVDLRGEENGVNVEIQFTLVGPAAGKPPEFGLYWFDVLWGNDVLTSIPLRLRRLEPGAQGAPTKP